MAGPKNASSESSWEPDQPSRTCNGASAWVPTCGLEVKEDTFTLAPAPISDDQPQVNGVSPGHSGVSGFKVTLMSLSRGSPVMGAGRPLANQCFCRLPPVMHGACLSSEECSGAALCTVA